MDEFRWNDLQNINSGHANDEQLSFAYIPEWDEILEQIGYPQQNNQVDDSSLFFNSRLSGHSKTETNQQTLPMWHSIIDDTSPDVPSCRYMVTGLTDPPFSDQADKYGSPLESFSSDLSGYCMATTDETDQTLLFGNNNPSSNCMTTDVTGLQSPNQLPTYSSLDEHKLRSNLEQQKRQQESMQGAQPYTFVPPTKWSSCTHAQVASENQSHVHHHTKTIPERMREDEEVRKLTKSFILKRLELGYSEAEVCSELNKLGQKHNMDEHLSRWNIRDLEHQHISVHRMLALKPLPELRLKSNRNETPCSMSTEKPKNSMNSPKCIVCRCGIDHISSASRESSTFLQLNSALGIGETDIQPKALNMDRKTVIDSLHGKNKHMNFNTSRFMSYSSNAIKPDTHPVTIPVTWPETTSCNFTDEYFRIPNCHSEMKAPIPATDQKVLQDDFKQNLQPVTKELAMLRKSFNNDHSLDNDSMTGLFKNSHKIQNDINLKTSCPLFCPPSIATTVTNLSVPITRHSLVIAPSNSSNLKSSRNDERRHFLSTPSILHDLIDS